MDASLLRELPINIKGFNNDKQFKTLLKEFLVDRASYMIY